MLHRLVAWWSDLRSLFATPYGDEAMHTEWLRDMDLQDREHPLQTLDARVLHARRFLDRQPQDPSHADSARRIFGADVLSLASDPLYLMSIRIGRAQDALGRGEHPDDDEAWRLALDEAMVHRLNEHRRIQQQRFA